MALKVLELSSDDEAIFENRHCVNNKQCLLPIDGGRLGRLSTEPKMI